MKTISAFIFGVLFPLFCCADWALDPSSRVNFVSVKKSSIAEVHRFKTITGELTEAGEFSIDIDLSSVETGIPIRNERMQTYLFETPKFAFANVSGAVDIEKYKKLKKGMSLRENLSINVKLHGQEKSYYVEVEATKLKGGALAVASYSPMIVYASDFELNAGIAKLAELAGLPSIATAVPVTFSIQFNSL